MSTTSSYEGLAHSKWDCKYHIVFIPKGRKKSLYGQVRKYLGPVFHELASQRESKILEGHMVQDHVHMMIKIPPKYSVAEVVGYLKGKSAIAVARQFGGEREELQRGKTVGSWVRSIDHWVRRGSGKGLCQTTGTTRWPGRLRGTRIILTKRRL